MKLKVYRNIFVNDNNMPSGGINIAYYLGLLYFNAKNIKDIDKLYNKELDLYITCTSCAHNKYKQFIKINRY